MLLKTSLFDDFFYSMKCTYKGSYEEIYKEASLAIVNRFNFFFLFFSSTIDSKKIT